MKSTKKTNFIKIRVSDLEKKRIEMVKRITARTQSDLVREALFKMISSEYKQCL